jgi:hypothetical protein
MSFKLSHENIIPVIILFISLTICGCKKIIAIKPPVNELSEENVFENDASAIAVLNGVYVKMIGDNNGSLFNGVNGLSLLTGLSSDELTLFGGVGDNRLIAFYRNALSATSTLNNYGSEFWAGNINPLYSNIFICNAAIEGLTKSRFMTPVAKQQLLGEAKFLRAFFYFYLVKFLW